MLACARLLVDGEELNQEAIPQICQWSNMMNNQQWRKMKKEMFFPNSVGLHMDLAPSI